MPDTGPNYSLPPAYFVQSGDTILPSQHNGPMEDLAAALNARMLRNGTSAMTGNLQMGSKQITGLAAASQPHHAPRMDQVMLRTGANAMTGDLPMGGKKITGLAAATAESDAVRLDQVQTKAGMLTSVANLSGAGVGFLVKGIGDNVILRYIGAGNGMTVQNAYGSEDAPTITMGTPSSITRTSTNSTTTTSHTHALNAGDFRDMLANYISINSQGAEVFAIYSGADTKSYGSTAPGSQLRPCSTSSIQAVSDLTGTWRCMGFAQTNERTMWRRITA